MKEKLSKQFKTHCISVTQKTLRKIKKTETFSGKCIDLQVERRNLQVSRGEKNQEVTLKENKTKIFDFSATLDDR